MTACFAPERLPRPFDPAAAALAAEHFAERGAAERDFAASPAGAALIAALGGHSPYLADLAVRESAALLALAERGPDVAFERALDPLSRIDPATPRPALATILRQAKRQGALAAAVADITGLWALDRVTGALSDLAEAAIDAACAHLLRDAAARGELRLSGATRADPRLVGRNSGLVVLGMGKLGGRELNYSSDVDLMVLYEPTTAAYHVDRAQAVHVRIARDLVRLLEERTAEGYVFRTDLRLRPDPAATPLAVSIPAAITYYESMGQNWERAAMIKARPVGADRAAGESFLREIRPFVWRRHLDFAAVADIHSIKRQIHAHKGAKGANATVQVEGHDVKLGRGGIREIEFTAQVLQLIWGGRDPGLRDPTTLGALVALAAAGKIDRKAAADLADAYVFLRDLEHRLQMVADRQTHRMPEDAEGVARIASFLGFADPQSFRSAFLGHMAKVERHYGRMFEAEPTLASEDAKGSLVFTGVEDDPATIATLRAMGYGNPSGIAAMVRGWHHGHTRATRSERARELLTALMPSLLGAFAKQRDPDTAVGRLDGVFARLAAGVQVLSLLARNPALLDRLASVLGAAPQLADHLARHTSALEGLLMGVGGTVGSAAATLPAQLDQVHHIEEAMEAARRLVQEGKFDIDAATLEGTIDVDAAGEARSALADAAMSSLLPHVTAAFAERHGKVKGGALAIVALGKLGGREMLPGSDLDLILIYDHAEGIETSEGRAKRGAPPLRLLPVTQYFNRLTQQMIAAITAPGAEGKLYEVDMRLRPSGSKGPVAVSLSAFQRYHAEDAWTWERMALTRARVVAGPPALRRRVEAAIRGALLRPDSAPKAIPDAVAMRARMLRDLPPDGPWDVKLGRGGLVEVEFIAQALQLVEARAHPQVLVQTTRRVLAKLAEVGALSAEDAATLIAAEKLWRTVSGALRLTVGPWREDVLPDSVVAALLNACRSLGPDSAPVDLPSLQAQMAERAVAVRAIFERRLGRPDIHGEQA
ncbi:bifunctional [glutamine synthetase] adenylyltransferase/[glutamine synthetase]-adenylyl-L-tyrosine phosphorylase [Roseomonas sp. CECT 9278]|uniref:bifunctional [glutamine synthetase] adenylyltransferase/[glutamine synthetase]-adenylyl-L-tyrosine phosphorylase n=1 Tax=Roseomonas sp. CECT 9278 TaxID=2845823 RepID=UPI001E2BF0D0|nr:bifunctional [glutamine synthetase] adenylyltransferase/[glutamine synthetase]-adenylyl-L-tyrosine phosphorylase [Roseomonas sp. CECT 9278]CAH0283290.1 Bifunctional glutamine synthetase adenylyltransferase/adenylyl-removing enzyme [Roseomonas sp. CECT 9278]